MEEISQMLQPYKELVGKIASGVTTIQMLSGTAVCNKVRRQGSITNVSFIPFLGGLLMGIISLRMGSLIGDANITRTHLTGLTLNTIYIAFLYYYANQLERRTFWKQFRIAAGIAITLIAYSFLEDRTKIEFRLNLIFTIFLTTLIALPFQHIPEIIRTKDSAKLQFPMVASGTAVGFSWFIYGLCINNFGMVMQTGFLVGMSLVQLLLCIIYPAKSITKEKTK